ncbi:MAG: glycosyltransferase family 1 protein [Bacteroidales bacterium]|nr:glycosyltransferase family 1 protein [Bacteroidales bacterium]
MRIGFDAKRAALNRTGLGNYSRYVVEILSQNFSSDEYFLYSPTLKQNGFLNQLLQKKNILAKTPDTFLGAKFKSIWRSRGIITQLKRDKIEIFHGLSNELPIGIQHSGIKSVVTIHDLIFRCHPEFYKPIDRFIYNLKFRYACQVADKIIAVSECTKRDIVRFYHIDESKIEVIYQGCDAVFTQRTTPEKLDSVRQKYNLPAEFILSVGSIEERKNLLLAVKALLHTKSEIPLVAVGKRTAYTTEIENFVTANNLQNRVKLIHDVPFADLSALYQLAKLFVYPSLYEGFGIPLIEAIHSRLPVIGATGSCLEEAGGVDSVYVNPFNEKELAATFDLILSDEKLQNKMIASGKEYVKRFDEKIQAEQIHKLYTGILK